MPFRSGFANEFSFVFGEDFGIAGVDAKLLCDTVCGTGTVAGHHDNVGEAGFVQTLNDVRCFGTDGVFDEQYCRKTLTDQCFGTVGLSYNKYRPETVSTRAFKQFVLEFFGKLQSLADSI